MKRPYIPTSSPQAKQGHLVNTANKTKPTYIVQSVTYMDEIQNYMTVDLKFARRLARILSLYVGTVFVRMHAIQGINGVIAQYCDGRLL